MVKFGITVFLFTQLIPQWGWSNERKELFDTYFEKAAKLRYNQPDSALFYSKQALQLAQKDKNREWEGMAYNQLGGIQYIKGSYNESLAYYSKAYQFFLTTENTLEQSKAMNGLGLIHLAQHEYAKAAAKFETCLKQALKGNHLSMILRGYLNLGIAQSELFLYQEAKRNLQKTAELSIAQQDTTHLAMSYNRLGKVYFDTKQLDSAAYFYAQVEKLGDRLNQWEKTFLYAGKAELALFQKKYAEAIQHGLVSYAVAKEMNAFWDMQRASRILSDAYESQGNLRKALDFCHLNKIHTDSLYNKQKTTEINFLRLQLAEADKIQWVQDKQLLIQTNRMQWILALGLGILTILLGILAFAYRKNLHLRERFNIRLRSANVELSEQKEQIERQNKDLNEVNQAKNKLFSILSHDLRGPIGNLRQFLEMEKEGYLDEEESKQIKKLFSEQLDKTERLLTNLLEWSKTQLEGMKPFIEPLPVETYVGEVMGVLSYQAQLKQLEVQTTPCDHVVMADKGHLRIILQNILNNAIKFTPEKGKIEIFCTHSEEFVNIHVKDSGAGFEESRRRELEQKLGLVESGLGTASETGTGLGLMLVKQLLSLNHGKLEIQSQPGEGTEVILCFVSPTQLLP